jgi:hypothetical protein
MYNYISGQDKMFKHLILSQLYLLDDMTPIEIIPVTVLFLTMQVQLVPLGRQRMRKMQVKSKIK